LHDGLCVRLVINIREFHERSAFEVEMAIEKLKGTNHQVLIKSKYKCFKQVITILSEITQHLNSLWNSEKFPEGWKESFIVPISKKSNKTDCNNYSEISHLSITYKKLSNILLSILTRYAEQLIGNH
jgi:hypothetical protein